MWRGRRGNTGHGSRGLMDRWMTVCRSPRECEQQMAFCFFRCVDIPERSPPDSNVTSLEESSHTPAPPVVVVVADVIIVVRRGGTGEEGRHLHLLSSGAQAHEFGKQRRHFCCFGSLCSSSGVYKTHFGVYRGRSGRNETKNNNNKSRRVLKKCGDVCMCSFLDVLTIDHRRHPRCCCWPMADGVWLRPS